MSSRLAFQTQLASIMEALANAAVAEICKLVDDDYAVVSLQMSQCQRENKALKRKLHLLELKMARGNAERRLRESAMNSSRPRVHISGGDRLREAGTTSRSTDGGFGEQMEEVLWSDGAATGDVEQRKSPDVELVEPELDEVSQVKVETVEANMSSVKMMEEEVEVSLIRDDGLVECVPSTAAGQRPSLHQQSVQSNPSQTQSVTPGSSRRSAVSRGVEEEEDVVLVKVEEVEVVKVGSQSQTSLSIQEGLVESSTDDFRSALPFDETAQMSTHQLSDLQENGRGFSESAVAQLTPVRSHDLGSTASVQLAIPDPVPNLEQRSRNPMGSEYSLFDLETFFTRWAPDPDSASPPRGPGSFPHDDSAEREKDGVIIVEGEAQNAVQTPHGATTRLSGELSSVGKCSKVQQSQSDALSAGPSVPTPLRLQTPPTQPPWSRASALMRNTQLHRIKSRTLAQTTLSSVSSSCRTLNSSEAPPVRGSTSASVNINIPAQHQANLLSCHNSSLEFSLGPGERRRKSYVCRACGKAFSGLSNLEAHERSNATHVKTSKATKQVANVKPEIDSESEEES
ncbi:zinc finger protein 853-like isoform X1 [Xyrichtys novacula]|uniref:Zinc finger protein 853-like isoform X1 n=1 Tax=Xyrichtys novacula TaxID=13765 RepID=A0AAV1EXR7_XYRNO|nr:zinc finger protein 853-like isoform X1 [Xyrichtys novacula]